MLIDTLFTNALIHTLDDEHPVASSVAVHRGMIVGVDPAPGEFSAAETIDLGGLTMVPGLNDVHHHLLSVGERLMMLDLSPTATPGLDEFVAAISAAAATTTSPWVLGADVDQHALGGFPGLDVLDAASPVVPLWIVHSSGHMGLANSAAFRAAGLDPDHPPLGNFGGGSFVTDESGRATGLVTEGAAELITAAIPPRTFDSWVEAVSLGSDLALSYGITSATDASVEGPLFPDGQRAGIAVYAEARRRGVLKVRMTLNPNQTDLGDFSTGVGAGIRTGFGDDRLRIGATKFYADGSLLGQTAAVSEPFCTNHSHGEFSDDPEVLRRRMIEAHTAGWQVSVHAIGDRAMDLTLDALEEAQREHPRTDARHRIEHAALTSPEHIERMVRLGIIPVIQPHFIGQFGDGMREALGDHRVLSCYRSASFLAAGLVAPGSSDAPVASGNPLLGMHDLVNRGTQSGWVFGADEAISPLEALRSYTVRSAYTNFEEHTKGRIAEGLLADFAVLSADPLAVGASALGAIVALRTVVGGVTVYER